MDVFVLTIEHRHGIDLSVHTTEAGAYTALATYCREYWDEAREYADVLSETPPEDNTVIEQYFDIMQDSESYEVFNRTVEA